MKLIYLILLFSLFCFSQEDCVINDCPVLRLSNPPPLFIGLNIEKRPLNTIQFRYNIILDIGAYEYWEDYHGVKIGDLTFNKKVTPWDLYFFKLCMLGPNVPYPKQLRKVKDGSFVSVSCWLADYDDDGDVDLKDFVIQQLFNEISYRWGDTDNNGILDYHDLYLIRWCKDLGQDHELCKYSDLNEDYRITDSDIELLEQELENIKNN